MSYQYELDREGASPYATTSRGGGSRESWGETALQAVGAAGGGALAVMGFRRGGITGMMMAAAGAAIAYQAISPSPQVRAYGRRAVETGRRYTGGMTQHRRVEASTRVERPRAEVYGFWRDVANLARLSRDIERIETIDTRRSRWHVRAPGGGTVEFEAEIVEDVPSERIAWRTTRHADVVNTGRVEFRHAPGGGTEVHCTLEYDAPGGVLGQAVGRLTGHEPKAQLQEALGNLRRILESERAASAGMR